MKQEWNCSCVSSKPMARRSLLRELNLAMSDLTPRKRKLYQTIRRKDSGLCKLRKTYRSSKLKDLCDVDSDPLMQEISNSLTAETVTLLAASLNNISADRTEEATGSEKNREHDPEIEDCHVIGSNY